MTCHDFSFVRIDVGRYKDCLAGIVWNILKADPTQRLQDTAALEDRIRCGLNSVHKIDLKHQPTDPLKLHVFFL